MEDLAVVRSAVAAMKDGDLERLVENFAPDAVADWSNSQAPSRGVYHGREEIARGWRENLLSTFENVTVDADRIEAVGDGVIVVGSHLRARGRDGIEVDAHGGQVWKLRDGLVVRVTLFQSFDEALAAAHEAEPG
ncbi:MAG: nuclear transport factor 2 family protein [Solirubrobacterales bacterium]